MHITFIRNECKKAKRERYEKEKMYMEALQGVGNAVGVYAGNGQGEPDLPDDAIDFDAVDADLGDNDLSVEESEASSDDAKPLFFLYDCESTGLSIYTDHIIEIAAEVIDSPLSSSNTTFSSLVKTSRRIPVQSKYRKINNKNIL